MKHWWGFVNLKWKELDWRFRNCDCVNMWTKKIQKKKNNKFTTETSRKMTKTAKKSCFFFLFFWNNMWFSLLFAFSIEWWWLLMFFFLFLVMNHGKFNIYMNKPNEWVCVGEWIFFSRGDIRDRRKIASVNIYKMHVFCRGR